jgi:hypothetical protein
MTKVRAAAVLVLLVGGVTGAGAKEGARDCRAPNAPPGVRVQVPPGCRQTAGATAPAKGADTMQKAGRTPGFIDLGNGSEVRIGGRVRVDTIYRR